MGQRVGTGLSRAQVPGNPMLMKSLLCWLLSSLCLRKWHLCLCGRCVCVRHRHTHARTHPLFLPGCGTSKFREWKNISRCDFSQPENQGTAPKGQGYLEKQVGSLSPVHIPFFCPSLLFMGSLAWLGVLVPRSCQGCHRSSRPAAWVGIWKPGGLGASVVSPPPRPHVELEVLTLLNLVSPCWARLGWGGDGGDGIVLLC